jgi:hypothetical protein
MGNSQLIQPDPKCDQSPTGGHFWKIECQNGRTSQAVCKWCGMTSTLRNSPSDKESNTLVVHSPFRVGYQKGKGIY